MTPTTTQFHSPSKTTLENSMCDLWEVWEKFDGRPTGPNWEALKKQWFLTTDEMIDFAVGVSYNGGEVKAP